MSFFEIMATVNAILILLSIIWTPIMVLVFLISDINRLKQEQRKEKNLREKAKHREIHYYRQVQKKDPLR